MTSRKAIPKGRRFEVFKRDAFTCQYCGRKAPDVLLHVDHIEPVSKGGTNDLLNLVTSCRDCNAGKSDRRLADSTVIDKQRQQLEELQARKEQLEMMFQWQRGLLDIDGEVVERLADYWAELVHGYLLTQAGMADLRRLHRRFELDEVMTAMRIAAETYLERVDGVPTAESVEVAWRKLGGICTNRCRNRENPDLQRLYYIRGILRNRLHYVNEAVAMALLAEAVDSGADIGRLELQAKSAASWTQWRDDIEDLIDRCAGD